MERFPREVFGFGGQANRGDFESEFPRFDDLGEGGGKGGLDPRGSAGTEERVGRGKRRSGGMQGARKRGAPQRIGNRPFFWRIENGFFFWRFVENGFFFWSFVENRPFFCRSKNRPFFCRSVKIVSFFRGEGFGVGAARVGEGWNFGGGVGGERGDGGIAARDELDGGGEASKALLEARDEARREGGALGGDGDDALQVARLRGSHVAVVEEKPVQRLGLRQELVGGAEESGVVAEVHQGAGEDAAQLAEALLRKDQAQVVQLRVGAQARERQRLRADELESSPAHRVPWVSRRKRRLSCRF